MSEPPVTETDLQAFVDGRLDTERERIVREHLDNHPRDRDRAEAYQAQNSIMQQLFAPVLDEPLPPSLVHTVARSLQAESMSMLFWYSRPPWRRATVAAVALTCLGLGWLVGAESHSGSSFSAVTLPQQAAAAHVAFSPDVILADREAVNAAQGPDWLSQHLGVTMVPPQLDMLGYHLVGGRQVGTSDTPIAQFMYHTSEGLRVTLYVSPHPTDGEAPSLPQTAQQGPVNVVYWYGDRYGMALSSSLDAENLHQIATALRRKMEV